MWFQENAIFMVFGVVVFFVLLLLTHLGKHGCFSKDSECPFWDDGESEWEEWKK